MEAISFSVGESLPLADNSPTFVPLKTLIHTSPLALTYLLYMLVTMVSVRGVNVPMYTTLKRTTVCVVCFWSARDDNDFDFISQPWNPVYGLDKPWIHTPTHKTLVSSSGVISVALIVIGAFIGGARDLSFDSYGYAVVFMANITTAIYLATIARIGKSSGLNSFSLMWCNGILCGPFLLFWTFIRVDLEITLNFPYLFSPGFLAVLLLSCILAFFLNYSIFLNTTRNSALTQTICGNLKDLFTIGLGWVVFGGLPFDFVNVVGQLLGFVGSGLYAYYKFIGK
ncbi:UDP-N-acetylglucosamine transporter UGNT1-like [Camellia sinensis]|uniref:UDP-N-acetylglucosamine transporter UGNT1-like n=1 Tax=Camellia sinensis TaxID=4442 RepID=UPI00103591BF|nr:UDP-N-acetylglucosamine transporter UGNT1-like [Camellia sinensis]